MTLVTPLLTRRSREEARPEGTQGNRIRCKNKKGPILNGASGLINDCGLPNEYSALVNVFFTQSKGNECLKLSLCNLVRDSPSPLLSLYRNSNPWMHELRPSGSIYIQRIREQTKDWGGDFFHADRLNLTKQQLIKQAQSPSFMAFCRLETLDANAGLACFSDAAARYRCYLVCSGLLAFGPLSDLFPLRVLAGNLPKRMVRHTSLVVLGLGAFGSALAQQSIIVGFSDEAGLEAVRKRVNHPGVGIFAGGLGAHKEPTMFRRPLKVARKAKGSGPDRPGPETEMTIGFLRVDFTDEDGLPIYGNNTDIEKEIDALNLLPGVTVAELDGEVKALGFPTNGMEGKKNKSSSLRGQMERVLAESTPWVSA
ncbi:hypothetical protein THAOC_25212, partial [Thalassiosira oceanica]